MKSVFSSLLFLFLFSLSVHAQKSFSEQPGFLWEISSNKSEGKSYIYGSMLYHDSSLFDFSDSLLIAIQNTDLFVSEFNIDTFYQYIAANQTELLAEENSDTIEVEMQNIYLENGGETFLDFYLFVVAQALNKECIGLDGGSLDYGVSDKRAYDFDVQSEESRKWIEAYKSGSLKQIEKLLQNEYSSSIDELTERNYYYADRIQQICSEKTSTFVIGVAQLAGNNGLFEILQSRGYKLRHVGYGSRTDQISSLYDHYNGYEFSKNRFNDIPTTSFLFPDFTLDYPSEVDAEMKLGLSLETGTYFLAMASPHPGTSIEIQGRKVAFSYGVSLDEILSEGGNLPNGQEYHDFRFVAAGLTNWLRVIETDRHTFMLMASGFSDASLDHKMTHKVMNSINCFDKEFQFKQIAKPSARISFTFPVDKEFSNLEITSEQFADRGTIDLNYMSFLNPVSGDEYFFRYQHNPPGVIFVNYKTALQAVHFDLAAKLHGQIDDIAFRKDSVFIATSKIVLDDKSRCMYVKTVARGTQLLLFFQITSSCKADSLFFKDIDYHPLKHKKPTKYIGTDFEIDFGGRTYIQVLDSANNLQRVSITNDSLLTALSIMERQLDDYQVVDFGESKFKEDSLKLFQDSSFLEYEHILLKNGIKGQRYLANRDTSASVIEEYNLYYNGKRLNLVFNKPYELKDSSIIRKFVESMSFQIDQPSTDLLFAEKNSTFFRDLMSRDSSSFKNAKDAIPNINFEIADVQKILAFLKTETLDEYEDNNAKYQMIISTYHLTDLRDSLFQLYTHLEDDILKIGILEGLAMQTDSASLLKFLLLLSDEDSELNLKTQAFDNFADSSIISKDIIHSIAQIIDKDHYRDYLIPIFINNVDYHQHEDIDSAWFRNVIHEQIEKYKEWAVSDTAAYVDNYIMDYYLEYPMDSSGHALFDFIHKVGDVQGVYRIVYNSVQKNDPVDMSDVKVVMNDPYFAYFAYYFASKNKKYTWTNSYSDPHDIQIMAARKLFYEGLQIEVNGCKVLENLTDSTDNHNFISCPGSDQEMHYLCVIYPLENEVLDLDKDASVYFKMERRIDDLQNDIEILKQNIQP